MKFKGILTFCLAGVALTATAQTHVEGAEYYNADQFENAKELLLRSLNNPGTDKAVSDYYLGLVSIDENNTAQARKYFQDGIASNPEYAYNYVGLGRLLLKEGDKKGAEESFKQAEKLAKKDAALHVAIARAYDSVDPVLYAKQITNKIEKARKTNANSPEVYIFEGDQLKEQKKFGEAGAKYEMAANTDNNATQAYVKYANLFTMVNPEYAITMLNKLLEVNPQSALGQRELAIAYYNGKDYANAAKEYGKYVQNPSHFKQDENRYAFLLFYGGDYQKGYDYASKLLSEDPGNFTAQRYQFMNAAQIPAMSDQLLPMAEALLAAHRAKPADNKFAAIDYTLIADELSKAKRADEAISVIEEGIKEMPDNAAFNKDLAMKYVDAGNITGAAKAYEGYLAKVEKPSYNDYVQQATFSFYAAVENKENQPVADKFFADTEKYAGLAAEILPDNYKPVKFLGDIAKQKATEETVESAAVPMYTKAIELLEASQDPSRYKSDAKDMYNYMGNYYLSIKDIPQAKEYFNKYLQYDPNNDAYRKFVEGLGK